MAKQFGVIVGYSYINFLKKRFIKWKNNSNCFPFNGGQLFYQIIMYKIFIYINQIELQIEFVEQKNWMS